MGLDNPLHIAFLVVILLLVFGARRLPEIGRSLGSGMREFKSSITGEAHHNQPTLTAGAPNQDAAATAPATAPLAAPLQAATPVQTATPMPAQGFTPAPTSAPSPAQAQPTAPAQVVEPAGAPATPEHPPAS